MELSTRDVAALVWLGVFAVWALRQSGIRSSLWNVARALWGPVGLLFVVYLGYVALIVAAAASFGAWNQGLLKDTFVWVVTAGLSPLSSLTKVPSERGFYRRELRRAASLTAVVELYLNITTFPLIVELILVPTVVLLGLLSTVAGFRPEQALAKRWIDRVQAFVGVGILAGAAITLFGGGVILDPHQLLLTFGAPIWLTAAASPFIWIFSLYLNYSGHFFRIDAHARDDAPARRRAKFALVAGYRLANHELSLFKGIAYNDLVSAASFAEARRVVAFRRAEAKAEEAVADREAARLVRYQGVTGTDWDGRPYDEREFKDTKGSLEYLAAVHRVRRENGRYRLDLKTIVEGTISRAHPDTDFVMHVTKDRRSWFAWRETIGGWYLGIGSVAPGLEDWTYLGEQAPKDFPRRKNGWVEGEFPTTVKDDQ